MKDELFENRIVWWLGVVAVGKLNWMHVYTAEEFSLKSVR